MRISPVSAVRGGPIRGIVRVSGHRVQAANAAIESDERSESFFLPVDRYVRHGRNPYRHDRAPRDQKVTDTKDPVEEEPMDIQFSGAVDFNPLLKQIASSPMNRSRGGTGSFYARSLDTQRYLLNGIGQTNRLMTQSRIIGSHINIMA